MDNKVTILQKLTRFRFILLGIFFGVLYWIIDTCVDAYLLNEGTFFEQLLFPESHYIFMRSLMGAIILIFSIVVQFLANKREITERALIESEEMWRSLVESAPNIIMTLDRNGKILFLNHTVPGLSVDDVVGSNACEYIPPEQIETLMKTIEEVFKTGKSIAYEVSGTGPHGSVAHYSTKIGPIKENGEVVAAIQIITDISERKKMENKLQEHVSELERFNKFSVGRELKMVELKQEINELLLSTGQPEKYKIPSLTHERSSVEG